MSHGRLLTIYTRFYVLPSLPPLVKDVALTDVGNITSSTLGDMLEYPAIITLLYPTEKLVKINNAAVFVGIRILASEAALVATPLYSSLVVKL